jgi:recombination protein RecR
MNALERLTEIFKEFPGIGERQAKRFAFYVAARNSDFASNLSSLILELKKEMTQCKECFKFFIQTDNNSKICETCSSPTTDSSTLLVVEKNSDLESVEKSRTYSGKYFILGGLVPIVEKTTKSRVRIEELKQKIKNEKNLREIILAFAISPQGNHTDEYVREELKATTEPLGIKISSLGRGLSTGTELEYSDNDTLRNALKNRQ